VCWLRIAVTPALDGSRRGGVLPTGRSREKIKCTHLSIHGTDTPSDHSFIVNTHSLSFLSRHVSLREREFATLCTASLSVRCTQDRQKAHVPKAQQYTHNTHAHTQERERERERETPTTTTRLIVYLFTVYLLTLFRTGLHRFSGASNVESWARFLYEDQIEDLPCIRELKANRDHWASLAHLEPDPSKDKGGDSNNANRSISVSSSVDSSPSSSPVSPRRTVQHHTPQAGGATVAMTYSSEGGGGMLFEHKIAILPEVSHSHRPVLLVIIIFQTTVTIPCRYRHPLPIIPITIHFPLFLSHPSAPPSQLRHRPLVRIRALTLPAPPPAATAVLAAECA